MYGTLQLTVMCVYVYVCVCVCVCLCVCVLALQHLTIHHVDEYYLQQLHNLSRCHIAIGGNDFKPAHIMRMGTSVIGNITCIDKYTKLFGRSPKTGQKKNV